MQTQDVRKIVHVVAKRAGIVNRVWPHLFRHSLATDMLERGASIYSIQAILGHAYVSTTMDYQRYAPSFV
jgi:site-specific recombinase XerD